MCTVRIRLKLRERVVHAEGKQKKSKKKSLLSGALPLSYVAMSERHLSAAIGMHMYLLKDLL